jgi:hypothetical protein
VVAGAARWPLRARADDPLYQAARAVEDGVRVVPGL